MLMNRGLFELIQVCYVSGRGIKCFMAVRMVIPSPALVLSLFKSIGFSSLTPNEVIAPFTPTV